jgi:hypothetical protein
VVFAVVFLLIAARPLLSGAGPRWWSVGVSAAFAAVALLSPGLLAPLNRQWIKLGLLLGKVVSPIALGVLFFGIVSPIGAVIRLTGGDPLRLKRNAAAKSYWLPREPPGPPPDSMINQY